MGCLARRALRGTARGLDGSPLFTTTQVQSGKRPDGDCEDEHAGLRSDQ